MSIANHEFHTILTKLDEMHPLPPGALQTALSRSIAPISAVFRWISVALYFILLGFAGWVRFIRPVHGIWLNIAVGTGIASMLFALSFLLLDLVPMIAMLFRFRKNALKTLLLEIEHDSEHAKALATYDRRLLQRTDAWLSMKIERVKNRLGFFIGGGDKAAILALAGMGWATLREVTNLQAGLLQDAFLYGVAFLGGLAIGGLMLNVVVQRYSYQRDLLALALDKLDRQADS
ncbi:hypothetical protein WS58_21115 [Burkholderia pseudomultivorans]|uniref:hypothetical protein n=1 Tax=Burkholderia pseudomultivorans TaxID=1207504 RepID=UPI0007553AEE|nr:hypothetical protein [Burkholderia pseudomultivorans]KVC18358.1 hypothetical protein WS55_23760 [Burkholderia pseudomultivorans]KVC28844.1 hypothetical protein WS56_20750 [Burkholderia pseudomultivorans]KVC39503.1 hypothetical protein WS58_21115 [Burkholderia pseudomultivorans]